MDRRGPAHSAPYGQACVNCFKSKCKCVTRDDGDGCERCHRLKKQCHPSDLLRRRNAHRNQNSSARIAQLEGRLEGLVSILQSVAKSPDSSAALRKALEVDEEVMTGYRQLQQQQKTVAELLITTPISSSSTVSKCTPATNADEGVALASTTTSPPTSSFSPLGNDSSSNNEPPPYEPSAEEAEAYLTIFCSRMLRYFAFLYIPPDMTAQQLRRDRPFLFRAIVAVASTSTEQKLARGRELKHILAQTTLYENQSSIDLLLGLLTYVAWGYDQFLHKSGTLSRLMLLAMSLVYDLRLNKPLPPDAHMIGPFTSGFEDCFKDASEVMGQRVLEQQRAVLGCFLLSSIVSSYFAQIDAMRWTPRMEEYLRTIGANNECSTDEAFAFQVRLQLIAQSAVQVREQQQMDHNHASIAAAPLPAFLYFKAIQGQLQELRESLSPRLQQQDSGMLTRGPCGPCLAEILIAHMHYVELCINETAHTANSDAPLILTPVAGSSSRPDFERLECLWRSVGAIKSWLDVFYTLSPLECVGFSFLFWAQLSRCLVILYRLSTFEDPAWDRQAVRDTVDMLLVLDRLAEKLELASSEACERSNDDLFMQISRLMRIFRAWAGPKIAPEQAEEEFIWPHRGSAGDMVVQDQMMQCIDFGNDMWWQEVWPGLK